MTIVEALKESQKSGTTYMRVHGGGGFVKWVAGYVYEFEAEDLIADDWESVETGIPKLTGGRWEAAPPESGRGSVDVKDPEKP